jgi:hypothetical protein
MSSRSVRWILALAAPVAALALASPAMAGEPTGEYSVFNQCPLSVPFINACVYSETVSGEVKIGETAVPIVKPMVFQGGETREVDGEEETRAFVPAANGETITKAPQPVPGGLAGLVKCTEIGEPLERGTCELAFQNGLTGVNATAELVGQVQYSILKLASHKAGLVMPLRVHLENSLLGSECYIGSASEPITLHLTTGTTEPPAPNKPISGAESGLTIKNGGGLVVAEDVSAVDNAFAVPTANGCGPSVLSSVIDPIINLKLGLPSAAGNNTAILNGSVEQASAPAVIESEEPGTTASALGVAGVVSTASAPSASPGSSHARGSRVHLGTYSATARRLR